MGVVRDITVEQLAQAVGGIDTSGLAKDTTLQATNTALGNINTTLGGITTNDPPTDTTQQSIASAISGLGATLGSDRALIDGSNIANPSAFRSNIGLNITSGTLTNLNSHVYYSEIKKTDIQVFLYVEMFNFTNQTETIIASISETFRPLHRLLFDCLVLSQNGDALKGYARGYISTDGNITFQNLGNYGTCFAAFTLTWFI